MRLGNHLARMRDRTNSGDGGGRIELLKVVRSVRRTAGAGVSSSSPTATDPPPDDIERSSRDVLVDSVEIFSQHRGADQLSRTQDQ